MLAAVLLLTSTLSLAQDVTLTTNEPKAVQSKPGNNPPPLEKFSAFQNFELLPLTLEPGIKVDATVWRIQDIINERVRPGIDLWNANSPKAAEGRTLVIQPRVASLKFSSIGKRIFMGPFSGSSHAQLSVRYFDKATGRDIAQPTFFSSVALMSGVYSAGGQDIAMLYRIATLFNDYTRANYDLAVGGFAQPADSMVEK